MIYVKRVYEPSSKRDGYRVLVDRLWPRGMSKAKLKMDEWAKDLAPSTALRKAYHAKPDDWRSFQSSYRAELRNKAAQDHMKLLTQQAAQGNMTLLSAAKDLTHNHVAVLQQLLNKRLSKI